MRNFGQTFTELQNKCDLANYDPDYPITKSNVIVDIDSVRTEIDRFLATPTNVRHDFAIHVC